jgi:hypothetical protein
MYNFELNLSDTSTAQLETLRMVENICEEFQLQDHFGTISMALHNFVEYLVESTTREFEVIVNFLIDPEKLSIVVQSNQSFSRLKEEIQTADENNQYEIYSSVLLTDVLEFREEDTALYFEFHVKPYIKSLRIITKENEIKKSKFTY